MVERVKTQKNDTQKECIIANALYVLNIKDKEGIFKSASSVFEFDKAFGKLKNKFSSENKDDENTSANPETISVEKITNINNTIITVKFKGNPKDRRAVKIEEMEKVVHIIELLRGIPYYVEHSGTFKIMIDLNNINLADPSFFGWLMLLNLHENGLEDKIVLKLRENSKDEDVFPYKISSFWLFGNERINVYKKSGIEPNLKYFPILPMNLETFRLLFYTKIEDVLKSEIMKDVLKRFVDELKNNSGSKDVKIKNKLEKLKTSVINTLNNVVNTRLKKKKPEDEVSNKIYLLALSYYFLFLLEVKLIRKFFTSTGVAPLPEGLKEDTLINISNLLKERTLLPTRLGLGTKSEEKKYENVAYDIILKEFNSLSLFEAVFSTFMWGNYFGRIKKENIDKATESIRKIIQLSREYSRGIKELAENIVEHAGDETNSGYGVITAMIYEDDEYQKIFGHKANKLVSEVNKMNKSGKKLVLNVIDYGQKGIVEKTIQTLKEREELIRGLSKEEDLNLNVDEFREKIQKDIDFLEGNGNGKFKNFFDFRFPTHFNHQMIRTIASMGILIFTKIVDERNGLFLVESNKYIKNKGNSAPCSHIEKDSCIKTISDKDKNEFDILNSIYNINGTHYTIILPFDVNKGSIETHSINLFTEEMEASDTFDLLIKGLGEEQIKYVDLKDPNLEEEGKEGQEGQDHKKEHSSVRYILDVDLSFIQSEVISEKRQIEVSIAKEIARQINEFRIKKIKWTSDQIILAIDVEELLRKLSDISDMTNWPLSNSSVYRILSIIEIEKSFNAIVLYKANQYLVESFAFYGLSQNCGHIWNEEQIMLFYNKEFLPFAVGGKTYTEWIRLLINLRAMYGNLAIPNCIDKIKDKCGKEPENLKIGRNQFKNPLIAKNKDKWSFLPLDVIISVKGEGKYSQTLFEYMVKKELKNSISKEEEYDCFKGGN